MKHVNRFIIQGSALLILAAILHSQQLNEEFQYFMDINDVTEIRLEEKEYIFFGSRNGDRRLNFKTGLWKITVLAPQFYFPRTDIYDKRNKYADYDLKSVEEKLPEWYSPWHYPSIDALISVPDNEYIMVTGSDEGASPVIHDIIDVKNEQVYRTAYQDSRFFSIYESNIWIGYGRGICRIDMETGERIDYFVLPRFKSISGWAEYKGIRYITTEEGDLLAFDMETGNIDRLEIPDSIITRNLYDWHMVDWWKQTQLHLSNPIIHDGILYIGAYPSDLVNRYGRGNSILLYYTIESKSWGYSDLGEFFGISKLLKLKNDIFCIGNRLEGYEGGDYREFGGLAIWEIGTELHRFQEIDNIPVQGIYLNSDTIFVLCGSNHNYLTGFSSPEYLREDCNFFCKIDACTKGLISKKHIPIISPIINKFEPIQFSIPDSLQKLIAVWKVKPKVVEVHERKTWILSREYFESGNF